LFVGDSSALRPGLLFKGVAVLAALAPFLAGVWLCVRSLRRRSDGEHQRLPRATYVSIIFILCYCTFYVLALLLAQHSYDAPRFLSPLLPFAVIFVSATLAGPGGSQTQPRLCVRGAVASCAVLSLCSVLGSCLWFAKARADGQGFASRQWRHSAAIEFVRKTAGRTVVYSNRARPIELYVRRPVLNLPNSWNTSLNRPNPDYEAQLVSLKRQLQASGGIVVYFRQAARSSDVPLKRLTNEVGLFVECTTHDALILRPRKNGSRKELGPPVTR
jgi:hypothetical protein